MEPRQQWALIRFALGYHAEGIVGRIYKEVRLSGSVLVPRHNFSLSKLHGESTAIIPHTRHFELFTARGQALFLT